MGSRIRSSKLYWFSALEDCFVLVNSADPNDMPHYVAFLMGLHSLAKYPAQWYSALVESKRSQVQASLEALCCVLEQGILLSLLSTGYHPVNSLT